MAKQTSTPSTPHLPTKHLTKHAVKRARRDHTGVLVRHGRLVLGRPALDLLCCEIRRSACVIHTILIWGGGGGRTGFEHTTAFHGGRDLVAAAVVDEDLAVAHRAGVGSVMPARRVRLGL